MAIKKQSKNLQQYRRYRAGKGKKSAGRAAKIFGLILVSFSFFSVMFIGYKSLAGSSVFYALNLTVEGCDRLTKEEVLSLGGVGIHTNLLAVDPQDIQTSIESHAWVEKVEVLRKLPDVLSITIKERRPFAMINFQDGLYYVDKKAEVYAQVNPQDDHDFPVITGMEKKLTETGNYSDQLGEALAFIRYASKGDSRLPKQNVSEMNLASDENIIVYLVDRPFPIYLGRGEMRKKYMRLARVLHKLYKREVFEKTAFIRMDYADFKVLVGKVEPV